MFKQFLVKALLLLPLGVFAQNGGQVTGSFQSDFQYYVEDSAIGATVPEEKIGFNSYTNLIYRNNNLSAGVRLESYLPPIQGFPAQNNGIGIANKWIKYEDEKIELTAGNFYDQFGNGLIYRTYEEKNLGYDNAMDGFRARYKLGNKATITALIGKQRLFFKETSGSYSVIQNGPGTVRGVDGEFFLNNILSKYKDAKTQIILGFSGVSKYQQDRDPVYNLPQNVAAFAGRLNLVSGKIGLQGEYAYKMNDPSANNGYIYKPGEALYLSANYSKKGLGILVTAMRLDNMSYRSDRNATLLDLNINYMPTMNRVHTYTLVNIYPYSVQPNGEMGIHGELMYQFKKDSKLGGKHGMDFSVNYTLINSIKKQAVNDTIAIGEAGTLGYKSPFFEVGNEVYFQELNFELKKKFSKTLKTTLNYINMIYNYEVVRGTPIGYVYANMGIADVTISFSNRHALRTEIQTLITRQDTKDWGMLLFEYSIPHWFFAVSDMYNYGNDDENKQLHYFMGSVGYTHGANRIAIAYGKQRAGVYCVGGVCRVVPASYGLTVGISSTF